ncbi:MAG: hypothetical protein KF861_11695 [Planctomycetaceae bacterium]|nr:hypothetical protein [Planctomycetaceae bacterium]
MGNVSPEGPQGTALSDEAVCFLQVNADDVGVPALMPCALNALIAPPAIIGEWTDDYEGMERLVLSSVRALPDPRAGD